MTRALFIDFEDSFSYNVIQELMLLGLEVQVLDWKDWENLSDHDLLVLGPGPGHPDDYQRIFPLVKNWISSGKALFGVCLGHQIISCLKGREVRRSLYPQHGQKIQLSLTPFWQQWLKLPAEVSVQRYNSLAVAGEVTSEEEFVHQGEVMISRHGKVLTYQFHPESVGTCYRSAYFRPLLSLLV
jgi:anthranilate synthase component II